MYDTTQEIKSNQILTGINFDFYLNSNFKFKLKFK